MVHAVLSGSIQNGEMLKRYVHLDVKDSSGLPECVNEAFNITSQSNQYLSKNRKYLPDHDYDSLICDICLKVMQEIDDTITDPDIEDAVGRIRILII